MLPEVGIQGMEKIRQAKVAVVGCGGLGCPILLYLASAGVGNLGLIDFDTVHITNLHRQVLYGIDDLEMKKASVAAGKLKRMHPEVNFRIHDTMIDENNATEILSQYDIVIDGCDNFATRYIVNDACVELNKPLVYGSILGFEGQVAVFNFKGSKHLRDLFPEMPDPADVPDCSENGVLATVPGIVGTLMANECLKLILNQEVPANKYHLINCHTLQIQTLRY